MTDDLLRQILAVLQQNHTTTPLGFCHPPIRRRIYCNLQYAPACMYFWDGSENRHEPIRYSAITCHVESLTVTAGEYKGKPNNKLTINIQADAPYALVMGIDTLTAKSLLLGLQQCDLSQPMTFAFRTGDVENSLFCDVFQAGDRKRSEVSLLSMTETEVMDLISKITPSAETGTPQTHGEWDGQQSLTPVDNRGVVDKFLAELSTAQTLEDLAKLQVHLNKPTFGSALDLMRRKWEQKHTDIATKVSTTDLSGLVAEIGTLVQQCHWQSKDGSRYLVAKYNKQTRAELTTEQLVEFRQYLRQRATLTKTIAQLSQTTQWDSAMFLTKSFGKSTLQALSIDELEAVKTHLENTQKQHGG